MSEPDWVTIAVLGRSRGNRGEITAHQLSSHPERYESLREVYLFGDGDRYEVESVWFHDGRLVFKFRAVDSIGDAERLVGAEVRIPANERVQLEEGEYFLSDLVGCEVIERSSARSLGAVTGWQEYGGPPLLEVGDLLIPFARSICVEIDPQSRRILVELPEGLEEVNRR